MKLHCDLGITQKAVWHLFIAENTDKGTMVVRDEAVVYRRLPRQHIAVKQHGRICEQAGTHKRH